MTVLFVIYLKYIKLLDVKLGKMLWDVLGFLNMLVIRQKNVRTALKFMPCTLSKRMFQTLPKVAFIRILFHLWGYPVSLQKYV